MPVRFLNRDSANTYCTTTTINGQTGWRMPTTAELSALYTSGAMYGQGWTVDVTWSSTQHGAWGHEHVYLGNGHVAWIGDENNFSCLVSARASTFEFLFLKFRFSWLSWV